MDERQDKLIDYDEDLKFNNWKLLNGLEPNKNHLEEEKQKFTKFSSIFIDNIDFEGNQCNGRPRFYLKDLLKSLIIMSYNGMSYRRTESDLNELKEKGIIKKIPTRSTLNKYIVKGKIKRIIEKLIHLSALFFVENEDTLIVDSTWLATKMYAGGYRNKKPYNKGTSEKCRKLHIACLMNSRIIANAKVSSGLAHDNPFFKDLVLGAVKIGFNIKKLLADAGYSCKDNYTFCEDLNINDVYIDFKKNASFKRPQSFIWKEKLRMFRENPESWHENYRFRVLVEGIFSSLKRTQQNYLRSRKETSQDVELLLKALCYNFRIITKFLN